MTVLSFIKNKLASFENESVAVRLRYVIQQLSTVGIKANYDPITADENRIILYSNRYNSRNFELASECNGLVIDYTTWEILYCPTSLPNAQFSINNVNNNFAEYDVYPLRDGTVVGLYYYNDKWRISTARGIDMGDLSWCGITYKEAINDTMAASHGFQWSELDIDASYTVGFTHPKMHYTQTLAIWLIRAQVTETAVELSMSTFEVQVQTAITTYKTFKELQTVCADPENQGWGFIIRSRNTNKTGIDSTVLLESRRMMLVRTLIYDRALQDEAGFMGISREQYAFCRSLQDESQQQNYLTIYPENEMLQTKALASLREMVSSIITTDESAKKRLSPTANWIYQHMSVIRNISTMTESQVMDYILSPSCLGIVVHHLSEVSLLP